MASRDGVPLVYFASGAAALLVACLYWLRGLQDILYGREYILLFLLPTALVGVVIGLSRREFWAGAIPEAVGASLWFLSVVSVALGALLWEPLRNRGRVLFDSHAALLAATAAVFLLLAGATLLGRPQAAGRLVRFVHSFGLIVVAYHLARISAQLYLATRVSELEGFGAWLAELWSRLLVSLLACVVLAASVVLKRRGNVRGDVVEQTAGRPRPAVSEPQPDD